MVISPKIQALLLSWLLLLCFSSFASSSTLRKIPRLRVHGGHKGRNSKGINNISPDSKLDFKTFYYKQTLDHFNYNPESYATFQQRYLVNLKYWKSGKAAPIFAYLGAESTIDDDVGSTGFLDDNAPRFGALQVYIEHRYYGKSIPFGSSEEALKNATIRGYFNSAQALADYAEVLLKVKNQFSAQTSPIIVSGGSYGGMLAAWFRLKYPHIAIGAMASSAPILYFDKITPTVGYYSLVTKDFREASESCYKTIKQSWSEIDKIAAQANGLSTLSKKFRTCKTLKDASYLKNYLDSMYCEAAQYDMPPKYPVNVVCSGIDGAKEGTDILGRIFSGVVTYYGNKSCYELQDDFFSSETLDGWEWQTCSEMVIPIGIPNNDTMFPASPFDLKEYLDDCKKLYGVSPRPHWMTTYYGGHHIKEVLKRFGSNIIFSNGLRDPYSSGGVLENISKSLVAVTTPKGSHCLDILPARDDDPKWLVLQRKKIVEIINKWILKYYEDLLQSSN